ncbi:MAG: hypothetical protein IKN70_05545 [Fibrobacter sp.]|nr:hypothetical protein [Fibrobacter sp.]
MNFFRIFAYFCAAGILVGCASMPRELSDHKQIPGGEYTGFAENNRPEEIRYQKLPDDIQYVRASDSLVNATYDKLKAALATDDIVLDIAEYLFLMPGTWEKISSIGKTGDFNKRRNTFTVTAGKEKFKFMYAIPKTDKSAKNAWKVVKREIRRPAVYTAAPGSEEADALGNISIRSISTQEMETIVWFSPFKMVEPLFVVNDKYLLGFNKQGKLEVIDEIPYYIPFYERLKALVAEYEQKKQQMSQQQKQ